MCRRLSYGSGLTRLITLATAVVLLAAPPDGAAQTPKTVVVDAADYAYRAIDTLSAGPTLFALNNHGKVRHEVILLQLKEGRSLADYMRDTTQQARLAVTDALIGLVLAEPGKHAPGKLLVDLAPGRTYLLVCRLRDAPDKPPHVVFGMITTIQVK